MKLSFMFPPSCMAGKHLYSCHYKSNIPISVSFGISASLAAGVHSSLAVALANLGFSLQFTVLTSPSKACGHFLSHA